MEIIYKTLEHKITENPTFVIGMCPGKSRDKEKIVFKGNRTGDFIQKWIKGKENLYLTNVFNKWIDYKPDKDVIAEGLTKLEEDIQRFKPKKAILLGNFTSEKCVKLMMKHKVKYSLVYHPSYVLRFNKNKEEYINELNNHYESN